MRNVNIKKFKQLEALYGVSGFMQTTSIITSVWSAWCLLTTQNMRACVLLIAALISLAILIYVRETILEEAKPLWDSFEEPGLVYANNTVEE